jgi:cyclic beta-1,2-glucan synthetase
MAHFLTDSSTQVLSVRLATDRQSWQGRNRANCQPLACVADAPSLTDAASADVDTGLDPVCALAVTLHIAPGAKARLTFATAASRSADTLRAVIDKYRQTSNVQRASLMSATLTGIRLRALRISGDNFTAMQTLTSALVMSLARPHMRAVRPENAASEVCDRTLLWRFDISGDRPIVLVLASVADGLGLLRSLSQALSLWLWGNIACDLVVINAEPTSYLMTLDHEIAAMRERHLADCNAKAGTALAHMHLLHASDLSHQELSTLHGLARVVLRADGRPLTHHVQEWLHLHELALERRLDTSSASLPMAAATSGVPQACQGEFLAGAGEFALDVKASLRPIRPWINVLSNPAFGAQISEAGGGYTWAVNSRLNQLTAWSNDPVSDPPSEWFLLQNSKTKEVWSVAPSAGVYQTLSYRVTHGQGYSSIQHQRGDLEVTATWCVDAITSVKQVRLSFLNHGRKTLHLRVIGIAEWLMGANRTDRGTVRTAMLHDQTLTALLCTQRERSAGFGEGTAFFSLDDASTDSSDWTCDRRECFDARGRLVVPDFYGQLCGDGLDPCAALSTQLVLGTGESGERTFLLGYAHTAEQARQLLAQAAAVPAAQRLDEVRASWARLLSATQVKTPDPLFDALVNHWLLYQAVSCRLWAKAGFYQAGGAIGFRDQLQDAMALAWAAPQMLRAQIVLNASRQFIQGDVQHWWHEPLGVGVRTHFSDDLLWLAYACNHYLQATGDTTLLDEQVAFLDGAPIPAGAEDAYYAPTLSPQQASVYEHAARAIDRSLNVGSHGLPLMGSGDWNDGMNRVGIEGRGESVWLGWFLCRLIADFAPIARTRGDAHRADRWEHAASRLKEALTGTAWDGQWFKRAYFDDGQPLGAADNPEARIDLIAQAWAVLSNVAPLPQQRQAMASADALLVDPDAGLIRLLDPPLVNAVPSAGYIQAYPPGVRENGGQYSHAGIWALMAQAELAKTDLNTGDALHSHAAGNTVYRYFTYLSPAHRASHPTRGPAYGLEPYVMADDIYSQPPYVGRGGWSWYTGAAAWLHRSAIESIFGLSQQARTLSFQPCLPSHWQQVELTLVRDERHMRFILMRTTAQTALAATAQWHANLLLPGELLHWTELAPQTCFVIPLVR